MLLWGRPRLSWQLPENGACLSRSRTSIINAFFIIIVLLRHISQRLVPFEGIDACYHAYFNCLAGQAIVSSFFFFSGYGIMKSILGKGEAYVRELMNKRFVRLYFNTAVCCALSCLIYGLTYLSPTKAALYFVRTMVGAGGCWFIVMTLAIYVMVWIVFKVRGLRNLLGSVVLVSALIYVLCVALVFVKPMWWLDTELCFPCGMLLAIYLPMIESAIRKIRLPIGLVGVTFIVAGWFLMINHMDAYYLVSDCFLTGFLSQGRIQLIGHAYHILIYPLCSVVWVLGILWMFATVQWKKEPAFLVWLGGPAVFYLFVLHFIPIRLIQYWGTDGDFPIGVISESFGWGAQYPKLVVASVVLSSILLAYVAHKLLPKLTQLVGISSK